ncbi:hypothetical protein H0H87_008322 [Tephrocybe sp. NHM501043]|nr:hypothetical protein H0H87_008322 [Tephrocybe sp. NHM501043]
MPQDTSPPPTPSPTPDPKLSRKREREVSVEPVSTPKSLTSLMPTFIQDSDAPRESRETRTPAKKNRTKLDATEEEDEISRSRSNSGSPPLSASPPQEMKIRVRQISQGVEDINWQNKNATNSDKDIEVDPASTFAIAEREKDIDETSDGPADSEVSNAAPGEMAESESGDKNLKRKLSERGTSQGPPDSYPVPSEPLKRPRDDDNDENPRETKRPSPPPEPKPPKSPKKTPATVPAPSKMSGFMAYASPNSPFSAVKGQNIFTSNKATSPPPEKQPPAPPMAIFGSADASSSSSTSSAVKRSGFEAFASPLSPFASASRSKSPVLGSTSKLGRAKSPPRRGNSINSNAFSSYAGGVQSFAIPPSKRARAGTPGSSSERTLGASVFGSADDVASESGDEEAPTGEGSFGEKLRAGKDDDDEGIVEQENIYKLTEQHVLTGEEDEQTIHQVRGKLFSLVDGTQWKERGTGTIKLNVKRSDGSGARLGKSNAPVIIIRGF